jgi:hypothetical protein
MVPVGQVSVAIPLASFEPSALVLSPPKVAAIPERWVTLLHVAEDFAAQALGAALVQIHLEPLWQSWLRLV